MSANGATTENGSVSKGDEKAAPNMNVSVEQVSDVERKLDVEVPWDDVKGRLDEAYDELKRGVAIKGFRKGKVPRRMLEQLFGKHVVKEVAQRLVQETMPQALQDNEITPVSEPRVEDQGIADGESFKYVASLQIVPPVEAQDYFGVDVNVRPTQVNDTAIELALERKQREMTDYRSVEGRPTRPGDVLLVDVMGKAGDKPIDLEQSVVELGDSPREPLPGLAAALTGLPVDKQEVEVELDIPAEHQHAPGEEHHEGEEHATQKARLLVTINEIREKIVPALDDDFAKDTGEAETLDGLKEVLRKKLAEEDEQEAMNEAKEQMVKTILGRNQVPVVPALVDRHLERQMALQKAILGMRGGSMQGIDEEGLKENLRPDATEAVQRALLLNAIAKKETVEVQDADVEKRLAEIAVSRGQNVARVRGEYEKEGLMGSLRDRIQEDKTLDLLMSKANIIREESASGADVAKATAAADDTGDESQPAPPDGTDEQRTEEAAE